MAEKTDKFDLDERILLPNGAKAKEIEYSHTEETAKLVIFETGTIFNTAWSQGELSTEN